MRCVPASRVTRPVVRVAVLAAALLAPRWALAEDPGRADAQEVHGLVPPRAMQAGVVPYPEGGAGRASVLVELVVDRDGRVTDAGVIEGDEPFAGATLAAARSFRFEPARRDGRAIVARIRMRVDFEPPAVIPAPPPLPSPAEAQETEVRVAGRRTDPGQMTVGGGEVRQLPGAFGDAFRAIEALPGPTPMASGLPYFFIRGAPPGDSGYFVDGVRVPLLFHAAFGPSVLPPGLIDHLDFFPGAAPVQFGHLSGGVLSASLVPPALEAHAEGEVRVFDAGALAETPLASGQGSALVAGRYGWAGPIVSAVSPIQISYADYQARATWALGPRDTVGLFAFGSYDDFGQVKDGVKDTILHGQFHRVDLRLDHALDAGTLRTAVTLGYGRSSNDSNDILDLSVAARLAVEERISPSLVLRAGADASLDRYDLVGNTNSDPVVRQETDLVYPLHVDGALGAYADLAYRVTPRVEIVPGVRADLYASHRYDDSAGLPDFVRTSLLPAVDPRLAARVEVHPRVALLSTVAVAHQPPAYLVPVPGLSFVQPDPVLQTAYQMSQGVAVDLPAGLTARVTGFLHAYRDMSDLTATCPSIFGSGILLGNAPRVMNDWCLTQHVPGRAYGAEILLRRSLGSRLSGWISYTLSRSTRDAAPPAPATSSAPVEMLAAFDRTHVLDVVASCDLGRAWQAGARLVAYSGLPYSSTRDYVSVPPYDSQRMPAFYRIDLRLEKRWRVGKAASVAFVLEGMNVTLNKEVLGVHCAPTSGAAPGALDTCTYQTLGPVTVPSVGVEGWL